MLSDDENHKTTLHAALKSKYKMLDYRFMRYASRILIITYSRRPFSSFMLTDILHIFTQFPIRRNLCMNIQIRSPLPSIHPHSLHNRPNLHTTDKPHLACDIYEKYRTMQNIVVVGNTLGSANTRLANLESII